MATSKINRKQEILDAALHCFNQYGYAASTIEMIREISGASVGSVYHHFGNKESIGAELYQLAMNDYHAILQNLLEQAQSPEEGVKAVTCSYVDWVANNPEMARFVLYSRGQLVKSGAADALQQQTQAHLLLIRDWFKPHISSGQIKRLPSECYASLVLGAAHDYARLWLSGRTRTDIKEFRDIFADAAWLALRPGN